MGCSYADEGRVIPANRVAGAAAGFCILAALLGLGGCTYTAAGKVSPTAVPSAGAVRPRIEYTTGDFRFGRGTAEPVPSTLDATLLGAEILEAWKARGYVTSASPVKQAAWSGKADYQLTLTGLQRNKATFGTELLNVLTVFLFPYTVTHEYEVEGVLADVKAGRRFTAAVRGNDMTYLSLLAAPAFPFAGRGHRDTVGRMAESLYEQFREQGAFREPAAPPP